MTSIVYEKFVLARFKTFPRAADSLNHAAIGIAGEAGELLDAVKKHWAYNKPLDVPNIIEELGDLEFYMQAMRSLLNLSREEIIAANITKLEKRFPNGYSDEAAQARADKA